MLGSRQLLSGSLQYVEQSSPSYPAPLSKQLFWQYLLVTQPESAGFSAEEDQS